MTRQVFRTLLRDVSIEYFHAAQRYEQYARRGDYDRADEALDRMKQIENCVTIHENSTAWRLGEGENMTRSPRILGRIEFTHAQARAVTDGGTIDITAAQFRQHVKSIGHIGDLIWVQEPFRSVVPKSMWYWDGILVGPVGRARNKLSPKVNLAESKMRDEPAKYLPRASSCVTLEIMGWSAEGFLRCVAHFQQVDEFAKARRAAA